MVTGNKFGQSFGFELTGLLPIYIYNDLFTSFLFEKNEMYIRFLDNESVKCFRSSSLHMLCPYRNKGEIHNDC